MVCGAGIQTLSGALKKCQKIRKKMQFVLGELLFLCYTIMDKIGGYLSPALICLFFIIINGGLKA